MFVRAISTLLDLYSMIGKRVSVYDSVRNFFIRKIDYEYEDFLKYIGFPIVELRILGG